MIENSENNMKKIKVIFSELQKQLFYLIPEKWDRIYLYASVEEKIKGIETGELFFYYFPKGILKKNPVNVYEVPNKFNLNEDEYIKLVENLYYKIKEIREYFKEINHRLWHSVTIRIEGLKFEIEYNYEEINSAKYSDNERHIIWKYFNLNLPEEAFSSKERKLIHMNATLSPQDYLTMLEIMKYYNPKDYLIKAYKLSYLEFMEYVEKMQEHHLMRAREIKKDGFTSASDFIKR